MKIQHKSGILAILLMAFLYVGDASSMACQESVFLNVDELLTKGENMQAWDILHGLSAQETDSEILWRMARTQYEMGRLTETDKQALGYFQEAEKYARAAMTAAPDESDGYKWLAIALGAQAKYTDTETQVKQSREIKESIEKAITLAPEDDISYLVLSRWHYKISGLSFFARTFAKMIYGGLPDASLKEAEKLLWKAIGLHDRIAHRYNLAKVYDRMDRQEDYKLQLQQTILLPVTFPEEAEELEKAHKKLRQLQ